MFSGVIKCTKWLELSHGEVEFEVKLLLAVSWPVRLGVWHPSGTHDQFFFLLEIFFRQLRVWYFVAPSLTRGRVCNLLLLLVLASAVPRDPRPYFIVPILETPPTWRARSRIYIPQEQGGPVIPPDTGFPFRRFLWLAGLRWRYSIPPPHGIFTKRHATYALHAELISRHDMYHFLHKLNRNIAGVDIFWY
jgi:hypothetical protein